jgi:hypothetical protein
MSCVTCGKQADDVITLCDYCYVKDLPMIVSHAPLTLRCTSCKWDVRAGGACACTMLRFSDKLYDGSISSIRTRPIDLHSMHVGCTRDTVGCRRRAPHHVYCMDCVETYRGLTIKQDFRLICNVCNTLVRGRQEGECREYKYCECQAIGVKGNAHDHLMIYTDSRYTNVSYIKVHRVVKP